MNKKLATILMVIILMGIIIRPCYAYGQDTYNGVIPILEANDILKGKDIRKEIVVNKEEGVGSPWIYAEVFLTKKKSKEKFNPAVLAFQRAVAYFEEIKESIPDGDSLIILNNGYVIDFNNLRSKETELQAMKQIYDKEFYKGDKIFTIGFLHEDNIVVKRQKWQLLDIINLPTGSMNKLEKRITIGIDEHELVELGKTFGYKVSNAIEGEFNLSVGNVVGLELGNRFETLLSKDIAKRFMSESTISEKYEESKVIQHGPAPYDGLIVRYQLVENYKKEEGLFKNETTKLEAWINNTGTNIIKLKAIGNGKGVDVPTDKVYDVVIKNSIK